MPATVKGKKQVVDIVRRFVKELLTGSYISGIREVFLYGSYAYGSPNEWSDIDVGIIISEKLSEDEYFRLVPIIYRIARKYDSRIEPNIFWSDPLGFVENEVKKGIRIYPEVFNDKV